MEIDSLFSAKVLYLASFRSPNGRDAEIASLPPKLQAEAVYDNKHIVRQLTIVGEYPVCLPYNGPTNFEAVPATRRKKVTGKGQMAHFFLSDRYFRRLMWNNLEKRYTSYLSSMPFWRQTILYGLIYLSITTRVAFSRIVSLLHICRNVAFQPSP